MKAVAKWPARIALLISMGLVAAIIGAFDAYGLSLGQPMVQQTSGSPSASPSPSVTCTVPGVPQTCRTVTPSSGGTASPSGSPTGPGGPEKHDSTITIDYGSDDFFGAVKSANKCEPRREVVVRKVRKGTDRIVGRDTTNSKGKWRTEVADAKGRYYAKVAKRIFTQGSTRVECGAAKSKTIRVV
jgi:hypothetical protein